MLDMIKSENTAVSFAVPVKDSRASIKHGISTSTYRNQAINSASTEKPANPCIVMEPGVESLLYQSSISGNAQTTPRIPLSD